MELGNMSVNLQRTPDGSKIESLSNYMTSEVLNFAIVHFQLEPPYKKEIRVVRQYNSAGHDLTGFPTTLRSQLDKQRRAYVMFPYQPCKDVAGVGNNKKS